MVSSNIVPKATPAINIDISPEHLKFKLDDYTFEFDSKPNCCEHVTTNFSSHTKIIVDQLHYFYMRHPTELLTSEEIPDEFNDNPCFRYHVHFVHLDRTDVIYEVRNYHEGYYPHRFTLHKGTELLFITYI